MAIYKVTTKLPQNPPPGVIYMTDTRLVEAPNAAQAVRHVASAIMECSVCTITDALELGAKGVTVEKAGD